MHVKKREREREIESTYSSKAGPSYEYTAIVIKEYEGSQEDAHQGGPAGGQIRFSNYTAK